MRYFLLLISLFCLPLVTSCLDTIYVHYDHEPVARAYFFTDNIKCGVSKTQDGIISFQLSLDIYNDASCKEYLGGDDVFKQLSLKHKDSFTGKLPEGAPGPCAYCFAKDFSSIDIVCSRDYDASHPAGTSLADIVNYEASSIYPWICNGYSGKSVFHISKRLSSVRPDDMTMIAIFNFIILRLVNRPFENGDYSFHITLKTDDGLTYEIDQDVTF